MFFRQILNKRIIALTKTLLMVIGIVSLAVTSLCRANEIDIALEKAQKKLKTTFTGISVRSFNQSPIEGLYEIDLGSSIAYYHANTELMFFGEIWTKEGVSLTAQSLAKRNIDTISKLPLDKALVIGEEGPTIIEFTDPYCPYCREFSQWITRENITAKRYVFFDTRINPNAQQVVEHILCSDDQKSVLQDIFEGKELDWITCDHGKKRAEEHLKASIAMGINGTPSFVLGGALVQGFKKHAIQEYLDRARLRENEK